MAALHEFQPQGDVEKQRVLYFRITGPQAMKRLTPLLLSCKNCESGVTWAEAQDKNDLLSFVYETTVTRDWQRHHQAAKVLNRLHGTAILEDKGCLALLQHTMTVPTLQTFVLNGRTAVAEWTNTRWGPDCPISESSCATPPSGNTANSETEDLRAAEALNGRDEDWWCAKASRGNGGLDVWVLRKGSTEKVLPQLHETDEYVLQRYVRRPLLWNGKKFHLRMYLLLRANGSAYLYRRAYILAASRDYAANAHEDDDKVHITNLSRNKATPGYWGQVPCDVPAEYPELWPPLTALCADLIRAAAPFLAEQNSPRHFEFLGLDLLPDAAGQPWLIEVNRLPGLASSKQNTKAEDEFYDNMCGEMIRLVSADIDRAEDFGDSVGKNDFRVMESEHESEIGVRNYGLWERVTGPLPGVNTASKETWKNLLRWAAHVRKLKRTREARN